MKTLKYFDLIMQTGLLLLALFNVYLNYPKMDFLSSYFMVGAGNVISCLAHAAAGYNQHKGALRVKYQHIMRWVVILGIATIPFFLYFLFALLFVSPLLAIFYYVITCAEIVALRREEKSTSYENI